MQQEGHTARQSKASPVLVVEIERLAQGHFSGLSVTVLSSTCCLVIISTPDRA